MNGWSHPATPAFYEAFCEGHARYIRANAALIAHAEIAPGMRILDLAAGTGRTAEAALRAMGNDGRVVCVEPSPAMRAEGMRRMARISYGPVGGSCASPDTMSKPGAARSGDAARTSACATSVRCENVEWRAALPEAPASFDRILCGAGIWQLDPLADTFRTLAGLLRSGGGLCFNIPALYLGEIDEPGGGSDPLLLSIWAALSAGASDQDGGDSLRPSSETRDRGTIQTWLRAAGLRAKSWTFRVRLTQDAHAAWLKIPVLTDRFFDGIDPVERARRIDEALRWVDRDSWKWERWRGWTAWKP